MAAGCARSRGRFPWLVAERDGDVAGYAYAGEHRWRSAYRWAADVTVYISAAHHRQGVGRALYAQLFDARPAGLPPGVRRDHAAQRRQRRPARVVRLSSDRGLPAIGYKSGAWRDVGWWQKTLREPVPDTPPPTPPDVGSSDGSARTRV